MITAFLSKFDALPLLLLFPILLFKKSDYSIKNILITVVVALVIFHGRGLIEDSLVGKVWLDLTIFIMKIHFISSTQHI